MNFKRLRVLALTLTAAPFVLLAQGCAPECTDSIDCRAKATAAGEDYTCVTGACVAGSPFPPAVDAGGSTGGGGGTMGGGAGGGGAATGGGVATGGGTAEDGGIDAGMDAGTEIDAGIDAGMDAGTEIDAGVDAGIDAGPVLVDFDAGQYAAVLSAAQTVPPATTAATGTASFILIGHADGGFTLRGSSTTNAIALTSAISVGIAGFESATPICTLPPTPGTATTCQLNSLNAALVENSATYVEVTAALGNIRGQLIPTGLGLWTAQLEANPVSTLAYGGAQFLVANDGGVSGFGLWSPAVVATAAHIHQGGVGGMGGPIISFTISPDAGGFTEHFSQAALNADDTDGGLYVNVHTADAPNGKIRGQLVKHY